jgi:tetratricopeptide (TPR) repeat protein
MRQVRPVVSAEPAHAKRSTVQERDAFYFGQRISTGDNGHALLQFNNGTRIELKNNASVAIERDNSPQQPVALRLLGKIGTILVRAKGPTIIRTAAANAAVLGTEFLVEVADGKTTLTVIEGEVKFSNTQGGYIVKANEQSSAREGEKPTAPVAVDVTGLIQWTSDASGLPLEYEIRLVGAPANSTQLFNAGRFSEAAQALETATQAQPGNAALWTQLGQARRAAGDATGAQAAFNRAIQLAPNQTEPRAGLALALLAQGKSAEAVQALNAAANAENDTQILTIRALIALRGNDVKGAVPLLKSAVQSARPNPSAGALLALAQLDQGQLTEAGQIAQNTIKGAPDSAIAHSALALTLIFAGKTSESALEAERAVRLNPFSALAQLAYGRALLAQGRLDEAAAALGRAEDEAPDMPMILNDLGAAYVRLDKPKRAQAVFERALHLVPNSAAAQSGLGMVRLAQGQRDEALKLLNQAIAAEPTNTLVRANLADYYIQAGDFAAAEKTLAGNIAKIPANGLVFVRLSEAALFQQHLLDAQNFALTAVKLLPGSAIAHYQLGRVYNEMDRTVQAEQEFRQAVILDRNFASARFAFGIAREAASSGRDLNRPLSTIASQSSGPRQALNVQNIQTPGAEERLQAAIQDPSVIRSASRSFGDVQLSGQYGEQGSYDGDFSVLKEINDRRGAFGAGLSRLHDAGVRPNADSTQEKAGFNWGSKKPDSASGYFVLGQFDHNRNGSDIGTISDPIFATRRTEKTVPQLIAGYNFQNKQNHQTRLLISADNPTFDLVESNSSISSIINGLHMEVRHDLQQGKHWLSFGASGGQRRFENNSFNKGFNPGDPDFIFHSNVFLGQEQLYARDEYQLNDAVALTGEFKLERLTKRAASQILSPFFLQSTDPTVQAVMGVPKLVLTYTPNPANVFRLRARVSTGDIEDFQLLSPTDVFLFDAPTTAGIQPFQRGHVIESEWTHTFSNASFLRLGAFSRSLDGDFSLGAESMINSRYNSVTARYEGNLSRTTTFFVGGEWNDATANRLNIFSQQPMARSEVSFIPRYAGEVGLQYLNKSGWFAQPSVAYTSSRMVTNPNIIGYRSRAGGFGLANLRIGKRAGLRSVAFIEVRNIFDKNYIIPSTTPGGALSEGRQFRVGAAYRF